MPDKIDKNSFLLLKKHKEIFEKLSKEQAGELILAVFEYEETGTEPKLEGNLEFAFIPIRQWLDEKRDQYKHTCEVNAKNGAKGGRPKKRKDIEKSEKTERFFDKAKKGESDSDSDSDIREQDSSTTGAGAREEDNLQGVDSVDNANQSIVIKSFVELFGQPSEQDIKVLSDLEAEFGTLSVWNAVCVTGKRSPPPDTPVAYVKSVIKDWEETGQLNKPVGLGTFQMANNA